MPSALIEWYLGTPSIKKPEINLRLFLCLLSSGKHRYIEPK